MKLRCATNSIRLRLRRAEVDQLLNEASITDTISFGSDKVFRFSLRLADGIDGLQADLQEHDITVSVAREMGQQWLQTDQVGLEAEQVLDDGQTLHLLVEKDFPCQTRPDEDKTDFFGELQSDNIAC